MEELRNRYGCSTVGGSSRALRQFCYRGSRISDCLRLRRSSKHLQGCSAFEFAFVKRIEIPTNIHPLCSPTMAYRGMRPLPKLSRKGPGLTVFFLLLQAKAEYGCAQKGSTINANALAPAGSGEPAVKSAGNRNLFCFLSICCAHGAQ